MKLTPKQVAFAIEYVRNGGNGLHAARVAGYQGTNKALSVAAARALGAASVAQYIWEMTSQAIANTAKSQRRAVATLEQALGVATEIMLDPEAERRDKLKAVSILVDHLTDAKRPAAGVQVNALMLSSAPPAAAAALTLLLGKALSGR